jgi:hypothetical protein
MKLWALSEAVCVPVDLISQPVLGRTLTLTRLCADVDGQVKFLPVSNSYSLTGRKAKSSPSCRDILILVLERDRMEG